MFLINRKLLANRVLRLIIVATLVMIAVGLSSTLLSWQDQYYPNATPILILYETSNPDYRNLTSEWGIYTHYGLTGVLLGIAAPILILGIAVFAAAQKNR